SQEEERDGDDEGDRRGRRELRADRPAGPAVKASSREQAGRKVERGGVGERDAQRRPPDHGHRRGLVYGMLLDRDELRRQDDAHVQGHRDGLANGLAGGRASPGGAQCRASLPLEPPPRMMPLQAEEATTSPPAERPSGDTRLAILLAMA